MSAEADGDAAEPIGDVDWVALWQEYGFDTPDAAGTLIISHTQLIAGLQGSEQDLSGDAEGMVKQGVEGGRIHRNYTDGKHGEAHLQGYICPEAIDDE